jgi:hypothetical protein
MRVSRGTIAMRIGALAAAAAITVGGGAAAASAATAAPAAKLPTTLTATVAKTKALPHGTLAVLKGLLTSSGTPLKFKRILLLKQGPQGHWHLIRRQLTHRNGMVRFVVRTRRTANYEMVYTGQPNFQRAVSNEVTVTVPAPSSQG